MSISGSQLNWLRLTVLVCICALPVRVGAQDSGDGSPQTQQSSSTTQDASAPAAKPEQDSSPSAPPLPPILDSEPKKPFKLGGGGELLASSSRLRWGPLYVALVDLSVLSNNVTGAGPLFDGRTQVELMRTQIVLDHETQHGRIALQYMPRFSVIDGKFRSNYSNQYLNLDTGFNMSPRLAIKVNYHLSLINQRDYLDFQYLVADTASVSAVQNNFLDNAQRWIDNGARVDFSYQLSARTSISVTPYFDYSISDQATGNKSNRGTRTGARFSWSYMLSPNANIGLFYDPEFLKISGTPDVSVYHQSGVSYSQRLTPSWVVSGSAAAVVDNLHSSSRRVTVFGSAMLAKSFQRSSLAFGYFRGQNFTGFVTSRYSARYDVSYSKQVGQRVQANAGVGYFGEIAPAHADKAIGKYASGGLSLALSPSWSTYVNYAHKFQSGNAQQLFVGTQDLIAGGIRWAPAAVSK